MQVLSPQAFVLRHAGCLVALAALALAVASARPYAGGWNDGSRLATVESLVERHTLVIDDSIFVKPGRRAAGSPVPYPSDDTGLNKQGTLDKIQVRGHFYSDKSPVPAILMAAVYQLLHWINGLTAGKDPAAFCYWMTVLSSGLAYSATIWCIFQIASTLQLPLTWTIGLSASCGLSTMAAAYARHVNNHILLLAVVSGLFLQLLRLTQSSGGAAGEIRTPWLIGSLAGLGYTIDLGVGPILVICTSVLVAYRRPRLATLRGFAAGMAPWLAFHHIVNYAIGGTFKPANAVPEYLAWSGSPFNASNMTGGWNHESPGDFVLYALAMLFGKRGLFGHNLPLFLTLAGCGMLWRLGGRARREHLALKLETVRPEAMRPETVRPELAFAVALSIGTWLMYSVASNNYSGQCCSIRWFLPLLAPGYFILALLVREGPRWRAAFIWLSAVGGAMALLMWWKGPWMQRMVPLFWPLNATALLGLAWLARKFGRKGTADHAESAQSPQLNTGSAGPLSRVA